MTDLLRPPRPPQPSERPPVDPRFRRRWAEARREEGRKRLRALLCVLVVVAVLMGGAAILHSSLFRVRDVVVSGNVHTPRGQVVAAAGLSRGDVLMVDAGGQTAKRAVEALPWVATATFSLHWPWTVDIAVRERTAVAVVPFAGGADVVDDSGRVVEVLGPGQQVPPLPEILGARAAAAGETISPGTGEDAGLIAELLSASSEVPGPLARADLEFPGREAGGQLVAYVGPTKVAVLLGGQGQMAYKLEVLAELAERVQLSDYSQVDLTVPERPALTPLPGTGNS